MLPIVINILLAIHVLVCFLLVFVVLLQRPRSEGLGSAFGGGVTDNMFGAQTSNVLAKFTVWLAGAFFALTLILSILYSMRGKSGDGSTLVKDLENEPAPQAEVTPVIPATTESGEATVSEQDPATSDEPEASEPAAESTDVPSASSETPAATPSPESAEATQPASETSSSTDTDAETSAEPAEPDSATPSATPAEG